MLRLTIENQINESFQTATRSYLRACCRSKKLNDPDSKPIAPTMHVKEMDSSCGKDEAKPRRNQAIINSTLSRQFFLDLLENHGKANNLFALAVVLCAIEAIVSPRSSANRRATSST